MTLRMDIVKRKTGCSDACSLDIAEDSGRAIHNGKRFTVDKEACMATGYDGPGWLTILMEKVQAEKHR